MELVALSEWLKTTIPGIILLGALGSIIAALILWAGNRLLFPVFQKIFIRSLTEIIGHFAKPAAFQIVQFLLKNGDKNLPLFYALQIIKLLIALFVSTCSFIIFALAISQPDEPLARNAVLVPLVISFLALWYGLRCVAVVMLPLYFDIQTQTEEAKRELLKEKAKEDAR